MQIKVQDELYVAYVSNMLCIPEIAKCSIDAQKTIESELKKYAEEIANLDHRMLGLRNKIEKI